MVGGRDLVLAWVILTASGVAFYAWCKLRNAKERETEAFGLGITVGREFHKMRDHYEEDEQGGDDSR